MLIFLSAFNCFRYRRLWGILDTLRKLQQIHFREKWMSLVVIIEDEQLSTKPGIDSICIFYFFQTL